MNVKEGDACPSCKVGKLKIKSGQYGSFLGCDMYHHTGCTFINKLSKEDFKDDLEKQADAFLARHNREDLILH